MQCYNIGVVHNNEGCGNKTLKLIKECGYTYIDNYQRSGLLIFLAASTYMYSVYSIHTLKKINIIIHQLVQFLKGMVEHTSGISHLSDTHTLPKMDCAVIITK